MRKLVYTFIIINLMISTALANVTVYRCLDGGDLCLTKTCCVDVQELNSCCSDHAVKVIANDECCDELDLVHDIVFASSANKESKTLTVSDDLYKFINETILTKSLVFSDIIRGPPAQALISYQTKTPLYIQICSFLC